MNKLKKYWKEIAIALLFVLFVGNCTGKGNYRRKLATQVKRTEAVSDSLTRRFSDAGRTIDSLENVIRFRDAEIASLNKEIGIYREQNSRLAAKPVVVKVTENGTVQK